MSTASGLQLTADQWADRIRGKLAATVEAIVTVGVDLEAAKSQLGHGRFTSMVEAKLGMNERTAQRFMSIARHEVLANPTTWSHLPASYRALAELARLHPDALERAIDVHEVTPESTTADAVKLVDQYRERRTPKPTHGSGSAPAGVDPDTGEVLGSDSGEAAPPVESEPGSSPPEPAVGSSPTGSDGGAGGESGPGEEATQPPVPPAPESEDDGYRKRIDADLVRLNAVMGLTAERVAEVATPEQRRRIRQAMAAVHVWAGEIDRAVAGRPKLEAM